MKKLTIIAALAALTISCNSLLEPTDVLRGEANTLDLSAWCVSPGTRADDTKPGEDIYNENALTSIDYFIYTQNSTANSAAVAHERWTPAAGTKNSASKVVSMGAYQAQYGASGHVFMVANLPEGTVTGEESVTALRSLSVPVTTFEQTNDSGKFKAQDSFVMISENWVDFTLSDTETVKVEVPLSRRAAKISIEINIAKWYNEIRYNQDKTQGTYVQTWYPSVSRIQVYMQNFTNEGTLDGSAIPVSQVAKFKRYERKAFIATEEDKGRTVAFTTDVSVPATTVTGTPFYSYPSKWDSKDVNAPFIKVILEWSSYNEGAAISEVPQQHGAQKVIDKEFYYKITIPNEVDLKSNNWYKINLDLAVLGSEADDAMVTIPGTYSIVAWSDPDEAMGGDLNSGRYLTVGGNKKQEKVGNIVYETFEAYGDKVEIPIITSHPFEVVAGTPTSTYETFKSPYTDGSLTYSTSSAGGANYKITPSADYSYVTLEHNRETDINANAFGAKDVAPITYTFKIQHTDDSNYNRYIKVVQYPSIYVSQMPGGNVFLNGYFQFLDQQPVGFTNAVNYNWRGNSNKPGYRSANYGGTSFGQTISTSTGDVTTTAGSSSNNGYHSLKTPYGHLGYDDGLPTKMTLITVTAFSESSITYKVINGNNSEEYQYMIVDPREKQSWVTRTVRIGNTNYYEVKNLAPYLTGQSGTSGNVNLTTTAWTDESSIMVGSHNNKNYIAPAFLISSRWGRPGGSSTFPATRQQAEQRCATYQEAGYPAGRWRLPTEAEVFFVYTLQNKGLVDGLFTGSSTSNGYWASSGRNFAYHNHMYFNEETVGSIRCVYDYWYWEEKDKNVYKFTPKP